MPFRSRNGTVSEWEGRLSVWTVFKLQKRNMDGTIPAELGRLEKLRDIWLYNNNLTGPLPAELGNLADLETLMLSHNNLSGQIPQSLNDLTLQRLWLKGNDFTGCMPANLLRVPDGDAAGLNLPTCVDTAGRLNAIEDRIDGIEARVVALEANVSRLMGTTIVNEGEEAPKETIVFSDLNWTSAQVQNRIAQFIVEYGYGYPTDVIFGGTLPNFVGLQAGDIHVTLEIWLPNQSHRLGKGRRERRRGVGRHQPRRRLAEHVRDTQVHRRCAPGPDDSARPDETGVSGALRHC